MDGAAAGAGELWAGRENELWFALELRGVEGSSLQASLLEDAAGEAPHLPWGLLGTLPSALSLQAGLQPCLLPWAGMFLSWGGVCLGHSWEEQGWMLLPIR